jgi:hypothetical protein
MSALIVELPVWARSLARWEVCAGGQTGTLDDPMSVPTGTVRVRLKAFITSTSLCMTCSLEAQIDVPESATVTLRAPLDVLPALFAVVIPLNHL